MNDPIQFEPIQFQEEKPAISFQPINFQPAEQDGGSVQKELDDRAFLDKPAMRAETITDEDIAQIARKHNVPAASLKELTPYLGGRLPESDENYFHPSEITRGLTGAVNAAGLGIPRKLMKMAHSANMESALDDLHNLIKGRESYLQLGAEIATPTAAAAVGKIAGGASNAAKKAFESLPGRILEGAATGAVAGAANADSGESIRGALTGGTFGSLIGAVSYKLGARLKQKEAIRDKVARELESVGADLEEKTKQALVSRAEANDVLERRLVLGEGHLTADEVSTVARGYFPSADPEEWQGAAEAVFRRKAADLADDLTGKAGKTLDESLGLIQSKQGEGEGYLASRFRLMNEEEMARTILENEKPRFGRGDNFLNKTLNHVSDAQFVLRDIEDRSGLPLEQVHRDLNKQLNRMSFPVLAAKKKIGEIFRANTSIDDELVGKGVNRVYDALDSGITHGLDEAEMRAYDMFKKFYSQEREAVNAAGLNIAERPNYVPKQLLPSQELYSSIRGKLVDLLEETGAPRLDALSEEALSNNSTAKELTGLMDIFGAKGIRSGTDLRAAIHDIFETRTGRINFETVANAMEMRNPDVVLPSWALDKNLYRLANHWVDNTYKHLYLREPIDKLTSYGKLLEKAGDTGSAGYVRDLVTDILGVRKGTAAEYTRLLGQQFMRSMDTIEESLPGVGKHIATVGRALPTVLNEMNRQIYPNVLGASARSLLMNATQPLVKTFPEIGLTPYSTSIMTKAMSNAYLALRSPSLFNRMVEKLEEKGLAPAEFNQSFNQAIGEGIERSSLYAIPVNALKKLSDLTMGLYTKGDAINRVITRSAAGYIANDLVAGSKAAESVLSKMPIGVRNTITRLGSNTEAIADVLASHLNASTQYNYNRASMSEFGRTMGPFFSTFSKWPSATAGEIIYEFRNKGMLKGSLRNGEKYLAPLMGLAAVDKLVYDNDPDKMSDRQKKLLGVGGFKQSAPLGSVEGIVKGDFFTPPAVDAFVNAFIVPMVRYNSELETDTTPLKRGISSAVNNFAPGAGIVRFLTDDLVTFATNRRPEGETFIDRAQSGFRTLTK